MNDLLTGNELLTLFDSSVTVSQMDDPNFKKCREILAGAPKDTIWMPKSSIDRYLVNYCIGYYIPTSFCKF
jgi:hypothetical protein